MSDRYNGFTIGKYRATSGKIIQQFPYNNGRISPTVDRVVNVERSLPLVLRYQIDDGSRQRRQQKQYRRRCGGGDGDNIRRRRCDSEIWNVGSRCRRGVVRRPSSAVLAASEAVRGRDDDERHVELGGQGQDQVVDARRDDQQREDTARQSPTD